MARYMRGYGQYKLGDPIVGPGIAWHGPGTGLAAPLSPNQVNRRRASSVLRPPRVVTPATTQIFFGPKVFLNVMLPERLRTNVTRRAPSYSLTPPVVLATNLPTSVTLTPGAQPARRAHSSLRPPVVIGGAIAWYGPGRVYAKEPLRSIRRRKTEYFLRPPVFPAAVIEVFYGPSVNSTYSRRGKAQYRLYAPVVVGAPIAWYGPGQYLTRPRQPVPAKSQLRAPAVVTAVSTEIFYGPKVEITRGRAGRALSVLHPPTILASNLPTQVTLAPSRRLQAKSRLSPPTVVAPVVSYGPDIHLTYSLRGRPVYELKLPTLVAAVETFYGPQTWLTYSRRGKTLPGLGRLIVVSEGPHGGVMQSLAPSSRGRGKSALRNYVVAAVVVQVYYGPAVQLARIGPRHVQSVLHLPVIPPLARPIDTTLAPQNRGRAKSFLAPPRGVFLAVEISGPETTLATARRAAPKSRLSPPVIPSVQVYYGPQVTPTYSLRGRYQSKLRAPAVVGGGISWHGPGVYLTRPTRLPVTASALPPVVAVSAVVFYGPDVHLAFSRRGVAKSRLSPPVTQEQFIFYALQFNFVRISPAKTIHFFTGTPIARQAIEIYGPEQTLARIKPPPTLALLRPPTVVAPVVSYGPFQWLTYGRRGTPKARLRPPAVVAQPAVINYQTSTWLTYFRQRKTRSFLKPPTRVFPVLFFGPQVTLRPQARGIPKSALRPPQVVRLAVEIYGPEQWLTYSRRGRPQYLLFPPAVVGRAPFRGLLIHLAPSRHVTPNYLLQPPTVTSRAPFRGIQVYLARIKPPRTGYRLYLPSVIGAGIAFYGPLTTFARIKHPPVHYVLRVTLVAFRRPHGDVCGFDIAGSFVCSLELPGSQVSGSTSTRFGITGSSRAGSKIAGSEEPGGSVSGSDRKAT